MQISENSPESSFKIVGLYLDQHLTFKHHVDKIKGKIRAALSIITRSKRYLPKQIRLLLFKALIQSHLQYAITIWGQTAESILDPLIKLQKKCLRIVMGEKWVAHCDPLFRKSFCLKLTDLHELACCKMAYKITRQEAPAGINNLFSPQLPRSRRFETFPQLRVPFGRIKTTQNLPAYQIPHFWNSLPRNISMKSIETFQRDFKRLKMAQYDSFTCTDKDCFTCQN